jgi:hypothetical protein
MQRLIAVLLALTMQAATCAAEDAWQVLKPDGRGFEIAFPQKPEVKESAEDIGDGQIAKTWTYSILSLSEHTIYDVTIAEYPVGAINPNELAQHLDNARDGGLRSSGGTLKSETTIEIGGLPARELLVDLMGMVARSRIVIAGNRLFIVGAITSKGAEQSPASEKYFASFKLAEPAATSPGP